jgi:hypothetical protein
MIPLIMILSHVGRPLAGDVARERATYSRSYGSGVPLNFSQ